jgi:hypothetical protein
MIPVFLASLETPVTHHTFKYLSLCPTFSTFPTKALASETAKSSVTAKLFELVTALNAPDKVSR